MRIDVHTHLWPHGPGGDALVAAMDDRQIDISVVLAIDPSNDERIFAPNDFVIRQCRRHPNRLIPFCSVDPAGTTASRELERWISDEGCRGLKLHPPLQNIDLRAPATQELITLAAELKVPVLIHTGPMFSSKAPLLLDDLADLDRLAASVPEATLILAHADPMGLAPIVAARHQNVYIDTAVVWARVSRLIPGSGDSVLEFMNTGGSAGWSRLVFGSDANPDRLERFDSALNAIQGLSLSESQRNHVLGLTAAHVLGIRLAEATPAERR